MKFSTKKVTVMGLGILGGGLGTVRWLCQQGATVTVTDMKSAEELSESIEQLKEFDIRYVLGHHDEKDFIETDMVIRNPAVPAESAYLRCARDHQVPVEMAESLFLKLSPTKHIIGITGTRGKSTTSAMIHHILHVAGKDSYLAGNQKGTSTLELLTTITADSYVVLELSSWQTESFAWHAISPPVSVITNIYPDHLNRYPSMEEYVQSKANIFLFQNENDHIVLNKNCEQSKLFATETRSIVHYFDTDTMPDDWTLSVSGVHNRENAAAAVTVARIVGIDDDTSHKALQNYINLPGRLENIGLLDGVTIINDTSSTTPVAGIRAIESISSGNIILIVGGNSKQLPVDDLVGTIISTVSAVVYLTGTGTDEIKPLIDTSPVASAGPFDDLHEALAAARGFAQSGDTILFSPSFTSFARFKNEFDRGDSFVHAYQTAKKVTS